MSGSPVIEQDVVDGHEPGIDGARGRDQQAVGRVFVGQRRQPRALKRDPRSKRLPDTLEQSLETAVNGVRVLLKMHSDLSPMITGFQLLVNQKLLRGSQFPKLGLEAENFDPVVDRAIEVVRAGDEGVALEFSKRV